MSVPSYVTLLDRVQQEHRSKPSAIFHYDLVVHDLGIWFWCVTLSQEICIEYLQLLCSLRRPVLRSGQRVTPTDLWGHRMTHQFKAPCCLCASTEGYYTECFIYPAEDGPYAGEHVAGCASGRCGYLSMYISHFYLHLNI